MNAMIVLRPGMHTLLQDGGRTGYQHYGVPVNGPMDEWSHRVANALVGNGDDAAVFECTLTGPTVQFTQDTLIALTGARMKVTVDGNTVPFGRAVLVRRGLEMTFGERLHGARCYLAVRGGFATEPVMGSRSTYVRGGFGGVQGRALLRGDRVAIAGLPREWPALRLEHRLTQSGLPLVSGPAVDIALPAPAADVPPGTLRFIPGPQWRAFTAEAQKRIAGQPYTVTPQSDRMGYRLAGPALALRKPLEMISEAVSFGTIQVPPDGQPIVLMADRQSAGGYPKIGYVATCDLPLLAQAIPGETVRFQAIAQEDAETLLQRMDEHLQRVREAAALALA
ncbi:biotin-dependent carboxylase-like uncharacterized protein [Comamonas sp. BIGb0124]|uniref:5-oxoprolinase subunit C family protein n=1 Tax=Comamonas sp. BIGb0124 TaxID=2485130 RepID=UPI000F4A8320|nr:biotin-dependent carboxyltransferase family protein [Comamonas sp. BIGb0124]ROR20833.1 biotin-dependent carboxylase-like uncharacterized protein [Comamonas sp. BIGb0124]